MDPLAFSSAIFDICFHPTLPILAVAQVDGTVSLHGVSGSGAASSLSRAQPHTDSVRSLRFTSAGDTMVCGSADGGVSLLDARGVALWRGGRAAGDRAGGGEPVNVVEWMEAPGGGGVGGGSACGGEGFSLASGDDGGGVKLWDVRARGASARRPAAAFAKQEDVITALLWAPARGALVAASGDGTLAVYDVRKPSAPRVSGRSENDGEELLSLALLKGGSLVVAGSQDGVLLSWEWGKWVTCADDAEPAAARFAGHPESIDALARVDDDTVVTGSSDGLIRLVTLRPNKLVGIVGEHGEDPVERLAWAPGGRLLASSGHDDAVRFWDVAYLFDDEGEGEGEGEGGDEAAREGAGAGGREARSAAADPAHRRQSRFVHLPALALPRAGATARGKADDEEGDEDDEEGDDDDDDDDDEEEGAGGEDDGMEEDADGDADSDDEDMGDAAGGRQKKSKAKGNTIVRSTRAHAAQKKDKKDKGSGFYDGLD
jgi:hypothetical protein